LELELYRGVLVPAGVSVALSALPEAQYMRDLQHQLLVDLACSLDWP
jgi:hypothetical protein